MLIYSCRQLGLDSFSFLAHILALVPFFSKFLWIYLPFNTHCFTIYFFRDSENVKPDLTLFFLQNRAEKRNWVCVRNGDLFLFRMENNDVSLTPFLSLFYSINLCMNQIMRQCTYAFSATMKKTFCLSHSGCSLVCVLHSEHFGCFVHKVLCTVDPLLHHLS